MYFFFFFLLRKSYYQQQQCKWAPQMALHLTLDGVATGERKPVDCRVSHKLILFSFLLSNRDGSHLTGNVSQRSIISYAVDGDKEEEEEAKHADK